MLLQFYKEICLDNLFTTFKKKKMDWSNEITEILKIKYPIIQAPMFGVTTTDMVDII